VRASGVLGIAICACITSAGAASYESPGRTSPADAGLSHSQIRSEHHRVEETVRLDGKHRIFSIQSKAGRRKAVGMAELAEAIAESHAIMEMEKRGAANAMGTGAADAGKSRWNVIHTLATKPGTTLRQIGKGLSRVTERTGEGFKGGASELEDPGITGFSGASRRKRLIAAELGIDPYTDNDLVQRALDRLGWAEAMGAIGLGIGTGALLPPGIDSAMTALGLSEQLQRAVLEASPVDLRLQNRERLLSSGIPAEQTEALLMHPWFSPVHETALAAALTTLGSACDRRAILQMASKVANRSEASRLCRLSASLSRIHTNEYPIVACYTSGDGLVAVDARKRLIFLATWDYPLWTRHNAELLINVRDAGRLRGHGPLIVQTDSPGSPRFQAECARRGIRVRY
jgi:hypothetical protein